jgi:menaquinone-specific isochorismate synthase
MGGFRFDPSARVSDQWRGYGDGFLVLPRVCYAGNKEGAWITENLIVYPDGVDKKGPSDTVAGRTGEGYPGMARDDVESDAIARKRWRNSVDKVLKAIRAGEVEKVVLARRVMARNLSSLSIERVLSRLIDIDPECTVFALAWNGTTFLGATPEPVIKVLGTRVECVCEAGSAPRGSTPSEDRRLGEALLADAKERREHSLVVNAVAESLNSLCTNLQWQETPEILKLRNVQHLSTAFHGLNTWQRNALDFAERLHPTPAVSGVPRDKAVRLIGEIEEMDRGWYGGLVGWMDGSGQGEFTIALRSALLQSHSATLYAGAGIVEGSDPDREYAETGFKLQTMMSALELEG